jgi:cyclic pyranopterin phosphate synthase
MVLTDAYGRPLLNLRVAVTRRCNLRCSYCHGEGETKNESNNATEMTIEEIVRIARTAVAMGISRVKLTGGEPLVRNDILEIVKGIASIQGLMDLSMTTNASKLAPLAKELHECGLKRVNVSLPTLDADIYHKLTGGNVEETLRGIEAAVKAGFCPVKINMLLLKGINESSVLHMMDFAGKTGTVLQLIELERINITDSYYSIHHKSLDEFEDLLKQKALKVETRQFMQSRRIYQLPEVKVEVVHPIENAEFCMHCTRLRVTSDGKLKTCLMKNGDLIDFLTPMRNGVTDQRLQELFELANQKRQPFNKS